MLAKEKVDIESLSKLKFCAIHPKEPIKYYCKDDKTGLCPECIVLHARHDFIYADEEATALVKFDLDLLFRSVEREHISYMDSYRKVETNFRDIEEIRTEQLRNMTEAFQEIRAALDKREA